MCLANIFQKEGFSGVFLVFNRFLVDRLLVVLCCLSKHLTNKMQVEIALKQKRVLGKRPKKRTLLTLSKCNAEPCPSHKTGSDPGG